MMTMSKAPSCASSGNAAYRRNRIGQSGVFLVTVNQHLLCHALLTWDAVIALQHGAELLQVSSISQTQ